MANYGIAIEMLTEDLRAFPLFYLVLSHRKTNSPVTHPAYWPAVLGGIPIGSERTAAVSWGRYLHTAAVTTVVLQVPQ